MQRLANGDILLACSDYHVKSVDEGRDQLAEIQPDGKVAWKIAGAQLVDQIEGYVEPKTAIEKMRIPNVHGYDSGHMAKVPAVKR